MTSSWYVTAVQRDRIRPEPNLALQEINRITRVGGMIEVGYKFRPIVSQLDAHGFGWHIPGP